MTTVGILGVAALLAVMSGAASAKPISGGWNDYQIIVWQRETPAAYAALRAIGVTGGAMLIDRDHPDTLPPAVAVPLQRNGMRWYVENIATDFYAAYHRYFPDRAVNWRFTELQLRYSEDPNDPATLLREPSLSDPAWVTKIDIRLRRAVAAERRYRPIFYDLADESGIADLSAFWDFDFSPVSLARFREWIKTQYSDLAALNAQWGKSFAAWSEVMPDTTRAAMARGDRNFSAWADFKAWMDASFAGAIAHGTASVHAADPGALAGIEGGQVPGWGGWDYAHLVRAVDVMEPDDDAVALVHSLNPGLVLLTVSHRSAAADGHRIWQSLLEGGRGLIVWEGRTPSVDAAGQLTDRGRGLAPLLREIGSGIGAQLINSRSVPDPIAILYSSASMRTQWMLDWKPKGVAWSQLDADSSAADNDWRSALYAAARAVAQAGFEPKFLSSDMVEGGALARERIKLLILPHSLALSAREAAAIRDFVAGGGKVVADTAPGLFDEHSRVLAEPALDLPGPMVTTFTADGFRSSARAAGAAPAVVVTNTAGEPASDVEIHRFTNGRITILALQRLGPGEPVVLELPTMSFVYDLRHEEALGEIQRVPIALDGTAPALFSVSSIRLEHPVLSGPRGLRAGNSGIFHIAVSVVADARVLHVEVRDPTGLPVPSLVANLIARGGSAVYRLALPRDAKTGRWTLRVMDILSGQTVNAVVQVAPRR